MTIFRADLHIHSRFSRATSKALNPRLLAVWSRVKGIDVLGTGDFTHPEWTAELEDQLEEDRSGLYRLKDASGLEREIPWLEGRGLPGRTLFMLQAEISSIYKRGGKVRKVHNLVFMPTLDAAKRFTARLGQVGNLASDGRPILGLDSRDLLEMVLETDPLAYLVPAHIWTPWFSLFGSKSGFDSIEECFGDLSSEIFALETGLSSDPEMNWMWSALDRFRLISNSDAHSGEKLAREANIFSGDISYEGIYRSLRGEALGHKFLGTLEFFPEEGKYHLDGHRKCGVVLEPRETLSRGGICPVCGKPLTVGVLNRVLTLADREEALRPKGQPDFVSLIPLAEVVAEILGKGVNTKAVKTFYGSLIRSFGSELSVLQDVPEEDLARHSPPLAEGISRMRRGEVLRRPGFDGEFGVITVFSEKERREVQHGKLLGGFVPTTRKEDGAAVPDGQDQAGATEGASPPESGPDEFPSQIQGVRFNAEQEHAIAAGPGPVLVLAGPGTGKTQTLLGRVAALVERGERPDHILAVTFTRRAAGELSDRLLARFGENAALPRADTLHALAFDYWSKIYDEAPVILSEEGARRAFEEANTGYSTQGLKAAWEAIGLARERMEPLGEATAGPDLTGDMEADLGTLYRNYVKHKDSWNLADFSDLLEFWLSKIENDIYVCPYTHILVDEVQDLSPLQLAIVRALAGDSGQGLFAIGDPDQSIYGFRGAHGKVLEFFQSEWPDLEVVRLGVNYRSAQSILDSAHAMLPPAPAHSAAAALAAHYTGPGAIRFFEAPSAESEAAWIGEQIRGLLGGTSHSLMDAASKDDEGRGRAVDNGCAQAEASLRGAVSPGDIAVLVRFKALIPVIRHTLDRLGLPCSVPEAEAFWAEPRVAQILAAAGVFLGITLGPDAGKVEAIHCPDHVIAKGPLGIAAYLQDVPPFDSMFWKSRAFRRLVKAHDEHGGWPGLLNWVHLQNELEQVRLKSEKIQIMSLHAAKGLEFPVVFLPCLEDGILPFAGPDLLAGKGLSCLDCNGVDLDEERRLLFVGMTRAERALYLSRAGARSLYGHQLQLGPSRFLADLPEAAARRTALKARKARKEQQLQLM